MKTLLYVSPPARIGGGEISLLTLLSRLPRADYRPVVVTYEDGELVERVRAMGIETRLLNRGPGLLPGLYRRIRRLGADLVHVNMFDIRAAVAARWAGVPLIGHLRVIFPFGASDRAFVRMCDRVISVSDAARDHFCRDAPELRGRFTTLYNAVEIPEGPPEAPDLRTELGLPAGTPLVGAVARIDPWKGLDVFLRAASRIRRAGSGARFVIAGRPGTSPEEQAHAGDLRALARDLGLESAVHFLGFRPNGVEVIRQLDVLLAPSRILAAPGGTLSEGFGRVVAEALAVGTPVVGSRAGGIPEILDGGRAGILVPPDDPDALAEAALGLLSDPGLRADVIRRGRERFRAQFTTERHVQGVTAVYRAVLEPTADAG